MSAPPIPAGTAEIPLTQVAPDAIEVIAAFRERGGVGFQDLPLSETRAAYELGCTANGIPVEPMAGVEDLHCPVAGGSIPLRHYRPHGAQAESGRAVILFLHGGGWVMGSLETHDRICRRLAAVSGLDVVAVDYRLAPEHPFPTPLEDCHTALGFIGAQAEERGWDPHRVVIVGDSAGGNIATVLATHPDCAVENVSIRGQVLLYPVVDLRHESSSYERVTTGFPLTADSMRWFRDLYLPNPEAAEDLRVSPGLGGAADLVGAPPAYVVTLGLDPLADEGIDYAGLLAKAGVAVQHHHLPRHAHGLFTSAGRIATGARMIDDAAHWVAGIAVAEQSQADTTPDAGR